MKRLALGAVLLVALGLGWVVLRAAAQRMIVAAITRAGGKVHYDWQMTRAQSPDGVGPVLNPEGRPRWHPGLVALLGADCFGHVVGAELGGNDGQYLRDRIERLHEEPSDDLIIRQRAADALVADVARLRRLQWLAIAFTPISDAGLNALGRLSGLESLRLAALDGTTAAGFKPLERLTSLRALELESLPLADAELSLLRRLTALRTLELEQVGLTDAGMTHLEGLVELRRLNLDSVAVTAAGLDHLHNLRHLAALKIRRTAVRDLAAIRGLVELRELEIMRNPIGDDGLAPIAELPALERIDMSHTEVTDAGLKHLLNLPRLSRLDLKHTRITAPAVAEFRTARPQVAVDY
jgi:hypothetical protein